MEKILNTEYTVSNKDGIEEITFSKNDFLEHYDALRFQMQMLIDMSYGKKEWSTNKFDCLFDDIAFVLGVSTPAWEPKIRATGTGQ